MVGCLLICMMLYPLKVVLMDKVIHAMVLVLVIVGPFGMLKEYS